MNPLSFSFILYPDRMHKVFDIRTDGHDPHYSVFISPTPYSERIIIVIGLEFHKNSPSHTERVSWVEIAVKFSLSALSPSISVYYHRTPVFVHIPFCSVCWPSLSISLSLTHFTEAHSVSSCNLHVFWHRVYRLYDVTKCFVFSPTDVITTYVDQ